MVFVRLGGRIRFFGGTPYYEDKNDAHPGLDPGPADAMHIGTNDVAAIRGGVGSQHGHSGAGNDDPRG